MNIFNISLRNQLCRVFCYVLFVVKPSKFLKKTLFQLTLKYESHTYVSYLPDNISHTLT